MQAAFPAHAVGRGFEMESGDDGLWLTVRVDALTFEALVLSDASLALDFRLYSFYKPQVSSKACGGGFP